MDKDLQEQGIKLIAPHRKNRTAPKTQDGRQFRRYKKRWIVERYNAHTHNYRKITLNYEKKIKNFFGYIQLAASLIILKKYFRKC
jgi:transposase